MPDITINSIEIDSSMVLQNVLSARRVLIQQDRNLDGESSLFVHKSIGGNSFTLGTITSDKGTQGLWCTHTLEELSDLMALGMPVTLTYRGTIRKVLIASINKMTPFESNSLESTHKKYIGTITLIEA